MKKEWRKTQKLKKFYDTYEWEKCTWHLFYNRTYKLDRPLEECIQLLLPPSWKAKKISMSNVYQHMKKRSQSNHKIEQEKKYNPDHYMIDITYLTKEEREIINKAYLREIDKIRSKETDTPHEEVEKLKKLDKLEQEYQIFLSYNPL